MRTWRNRTSGGRSSERDSVIFQDNDFEVFIDPDGDTHEYYEIEINALNTVWDLLLIQPYRDGGPAIHAWDIAGLRTAVDLRGTINRPEDRDEGWSIETAIPWKILAEAAPRRARPRAGDQWRVNFSRVQWQLDVQMVDTPSGSMPRQASRCRRTTGSGVLRGQSTCTCPSGGASSSSRTGPPATRHAFVEDRNDRVKWALRRLYYRQREYRAAHGRYAHDLTLLNGADIHVEGLDFRPTVQVTDSLYELRAAGFDGAVVHLREDGRVLVTREKPEEKR